MTGLLFDDLWAVSHRCDPFARGLYLRHYSSKKRPAHADPAQFVGPGEVIVLVRPDAAFVWRKFIDDCPLGGGVNCALFRNEGSVRSSELILEAEVIAWKKWPGARLYTYVCPSSIRSTNPGYCFKVAGWTTAGTTGAGLVALEKVP